MKEAAALAFAALAAGVVAFHLGVIAGRPWGRLTMGGRWPGRLPPGARVLSLASAALIGWMAAVALGRAGLISWAPGGWALAALLGLSALAVLANAATPSASERRLWLPVTVAMLVLAALVALS